MAGLSACAYLHTTTGLCCTYPVQCSVGSVEKGTRVQAGSGSSSQQREASKKRTKTIQWPRDEPRPSSSAALESHAIGNQAPRKARTPPGWPIWALAGQISRRLVYAPSPPRSPDKRRTRHGCMPCPCTLRCTHALVTSSSTPGVRRQFVSPLLLHQRPAN